MREVERERFRRLREGFELRDAHARLLQVLLEVVHRGVTPIEFSLQRRVLPARDGTGRENREGLLLAAALDLVQLCDYCVAIRDRASLAREPPSEGRGWIIAETAHYDGVRRERYEGHEAYEPLNDEQDAPNDHFLLGARSQPGGRRW